MEKVDWFVYFVTFIGGATVASLSRVWKLLNNMHMIKRTANDKVHWLFEGIYLLVNSLLGGVVGLGAYILLNYTGYITAPTVVTFVSCMFATASGEVFLMVQNKVKKTVEKLESDEENESIR